jgi:ribosomal protein S14
MKHSAAKDRCNRLKLVATPSVVFNKFMRSNSFFSLTHQAIFAKRLAFTLPQVVKIHNYCSVTSRSKGVIQEFRFSRFLFKEYVGTGCLPGVRRSSW